MRNAVRTLAAILVLGAAVPAAQAQTTRSEELPNNNPIAAYSAPNRTYVRSYLRDRTMPSVDYSGQLAVGAQVPSSVVVQGFEGDPAYSSYRYGRVNNRYIVVDQNGRVVDIVE